MAYNTPRDTNRSLILYSLIAILAVVSFGAGVTIGSQHETYSIASVANMSEGQPDQVDFSPFWKVWHLIDTHHLHSENADTQERVWGAIQGLVGSLDDPNTGFFPPQEAESFRSDISGKFEGVGMEVGMRDGVLTVVSPLKESPAYRAGVESQDRIVEINGTSTADMNLTEAVNLIRGDKGTEVVLTIIREGEEEPLEIGIVRDVIDIPTIDTELRDDGVFVISMYNFTGDVVNLFENALEEFVESGSDKLLIDLRGNPGGFLDASVEIASHFLPQGAVVVKEEYTDSSRNKVHRSKGYGTVGSDVSVAILVNEGSASASEIVAGALRDHGRAISVGQQTFGKGSIQEMVPVTTDTFLKVTIAEWKTPDGHSFEGVGVEPDIVVEYDTEDRESGDDPQLDRAVQELMEE